MHTREGQFGRGGGLLSYERLSDYGSHCTDSVWNSDTPGEGDYSDAPETF